MAISEYQRQWLEKNREHVRAKARERYAKDIERQREFKRASYRRRADRLKADAEAYKQFRDLVNSGSRRRTAVASAKKPRKLIPYAGKE